MKQNIRNCILLLIVLFSVNPAFANEDEFIEFCSFQADEFFKKPEILKRARLEFSVIFSMEIDYAGTPINIKRFHFSDTTNSIFGLILDEPFIECFQKWKLPPSYGKIEVVLNFKSAGGWTSASIVGKDIRRTWIPSLKGWQEVTIAYKENEK